MGGSAHLDTVAQIIHALVSMLSVLLMLMLLYQLYISFYGFRKKTKDYQDHDPGLRFLVLVPAHNEEAVIADIIYNLKHMEYPPALYDFYILADNCTDNTAAVARQAGANVIESFRESEDAPTGKPIVLQKALRALEGYHNQYDVVMFFDADNLIDPNMFLEINSQFLSNPGKADIIQCYLGSKNKNGLIALFYYMTYTITNRFFQLAKNHLGLNNVVGGTGFAVTAEYLHQRGGWASISLTEDFELQIEATCDGKRILWNHNVRIYDEKPTHFRASLRQRIRWAQGHWFVAFKNTRRLFRALKAGNISFGEFLSTFLYMYSLVPYVILVVQMFLRLTINIFEWTGLVAKVPVVGLFNSWFLDNLPAFSLFFYSFIVLYYVSDSMDNGNRFNLRIFIPMCVSMLLNTVLAGVAQVVGLFKYKKQNTWVKTEHKINRLEASNLLRHDESAPQIVSPEPNERIA